jgi:hypothetical protein
VLLGLCSYLGGTYANAPEFSAYHLLYNLRMSLRELGATMIEVRVCVVALCVALCVCVCVYVCVFVALCV